MIYILKCLVQLTSCIIYTYFDSFILTEYDLYFHFFWYYHICSPKCPGYLCCWEATKTPTHTHTHTHKHTVNTYANTHTYTHIYIKHTYNMDKFDLLYIVHWLSHIYGEWYNRALKYWLKYINLRPSGGGVYESLSRVMDGHLHEEVLRWVYTVFKTALSWLYILLVSSHTHTLTHTHTHTAAHTHTPPTEWCN